MGQIDLKSRSLLPTADIEELVYSIQTRGYAVVSRYLTAHECEILRAGMMKAIESFRPVEGSQRSYLDRHQMHDLICNDLNFARLLEDPRLQQIVAPLLGDYWIMYAATSSSIPPRGENYSGRLHVDSPRFHPGYTFNVGIIWTLNEYTVDNGAVKVLPGSHHVNEVPSLEYFEKNAVRVLCDEGSLIVFNAKTYHRTYENCTDKWRHSMTMNACRSYMKQRMDWVRFIPAEISEQLNPLARRLIGFDTRLPSSLEEFFVPEDERLYKPNQG